MVRNDYPTLLKTKTTILVIFLLSLLLQPLYFIIFSLLFFVEFCGNFIHFTPLILFSFLTVVFSVSPKNVLLIDKIFY